MYPVTATTNTKGNRSNCPLAQMTNPRSYFDTCLNLAPPVATMSAATSRNELSDEETRKSLRNATRYNLGDREGQLKSQACISITRKG